MHSVIIYGNITPFATTVLPVLRDERCELIAHGKTVLDIYKRVAEQRPDIAILLPGGDTEPEAKLENFLKSLGVTVVVLGQPDERGVVSAKMRSRDFDVAGHILLPNLRISLTHQLRRSQVLRKRGGVSA